MFLLSLKLLTSRIKWLLLLAFIFGLVISSVISIFTAANNIKYNLLNRSFQQYGQFSGVLHNLPDTKENILKKVKSAGQFVLVDSLQIANNKSASIGWVDQEFIDLGHIKLLTGDFPIKTNEVAIESYYLEAIDSTWKVGEFRRLDIGSEIKSVKLVGILENYSAGWSVGTINLKFPNLFISKSTISIDHLKNNYLIQYNLKHNLKNNINKMYNFINDYGGNGFLNERLFYNGLKDYDIITKISLGLQFIIILVSSFSILSMLSFFNYNQVAKFAILKAVGCTNKTLHIISILQTAIIYILGTLVSIPLLFLFHFLIVRNTYGFNLSLNIKSNYMLLGIMVWLIILFITIVALLHLAIKQQSQSSISVNLRNGKRNAFLFSNKLNQIKNFGIKQLLIQLLSNPRDTILSILTLSFSILVIIFSFIMAKESAGIWDTKIDYYLAAQELIGTKVINDNNVVVTMGGVFHPLEVRKIEHLDGIKYIDKVPHMLDVSAVMERRILTPSLISVIKQYNKYYDNEDDKISIPNVNYVLKTEEEISALYPDLNEDEIQDSIIIQIPGLEGHEKKQLIGKKIILSKAYFDGYAFDSKNWDFKVLDVISAPYTVKLDKERAIIKNGITIVLNENAVMKKGIFDGYKDLLIYTDENISTENAKNIYENVYSLAAGIPGSLFQYIPDLIHDRTRITDYLELLGKMAFYISLIIAVSSIYALIFGKYQIQKRYWGIYRSLGMSADTVFLYLIAEIFVYFIFAILISSVLLFLFLWQNDTTYPASFYILFALSTVISAFFVLIAAAVFVKQKVKKDSIASLL